MNFAVELVHFAVFICILLCKWLNAAPFWIIAHIAVRPYFCEVSYQLLCYDEACMRPVIFFF